MKHQLRKILGTLLVVMAVSVASLSVRAQGPDNPGGQSGLTFNRSDTAVVFTDPQNDVLSEKGRAWGLVGDSVKQNKTVENMERIFKAAKLRAAGATFGRAS
jgi:hypothetical protein